MTAHELDDSFPGEPDDPGAGDDDIGLGSIVLALIALTLAIAAYLLG